MSAENNSLTGLEIIESLQGLQKVADTIHDPNTKIDRVRLGIGVLAAGTLLKHQFIVSSAQVIGREPDAPPSDIIMFSSGMFFIARLDSYGYLLDEDIPVDCLSLNFVEPEIIGADVRDARAMKPLTLQVPVLAIDSFRSAEAAA